MKSTVQKKSRMNPDVDYAALYIVLLNINSSIRPSYLKDGTLRHFCNWAALLSP